MQYIIRDAISNLRRRQIRQSPGEVCIHLFRLRSVSFPCFRVVAVNLIPGRHKPDTRFAIIRELFVNR